MADRYWVGGTASWDGTAGTKWSATSGGAGGASVPTSADDVFFNAASGASTVTIAAGNIGARSINCTGFTGTITGTTGISVSGSITLVAAMTWSHSGTVTIIGTGTLTTAGKVFSSTNINGAGITVTLGGPLDVTERNLTVSQGTFTTNGHNITAGSFISQSGILRTINLGASTLTLSNGILFAIPDNLTFNAGTSQINITGASTVFEGGGRTFNNVTINSASCSTGGSNTFANLTVVAPAAAGFSFIAFAAGTINTITTLVTSGTAGNRRVWFRSGTYGISAGLVVNTTATLTDADFRDVIVTGTAAPISGTRIGDLRGNSGITFSAPKTVFRIGTGNWSDNQWSDTSGGSVNINNFPLAQDTAVFNQSTTAGTHTMDSAVPYCGTIDMSARTSSLTLSTSVAFTVYGNWINGAGTTLTSSGVITFSGRNTQTITSAGKSFSGGITIDSFGGVVELADAFTNNAQNNVANGTFDTRGFNFTNLIIESVGNNVRAILFRSSTITCTFASPFNFSSTNLTLDAGTSTIICSAAGVSFAGAGFTYNDVSFTDTSASNLSITGTNTFNNLTLAPLASTNLRSLVISANQIITGTLTVSGGSAIRRTRLFSSVLGVPRTLTVGILVANDCDFRDIVIAGAAAGSSPTRAGNCGGNSGVTFPTPKTVYWNLSGTQNWSATGWAPSSGGTPDINNFPLAQDTAVFDNAGAAGTVTVNTDWNIGAVNSGSRTTAMTLNYGGVVHGSWTTGTGVTLGANLIMTFRGRGTSTITSNGQSFNGANIVLDCVTGTVQLGDALTLISSQSLQLLSGSFNAVTFNVTVGNFGSSQGTAGLLRTLTMGSGTWTITGVGGSAWFITDTASINFNKGTANIVLSDNTTSARIFSGGGLAYNRLTIGGSTGISTLTILDNNSFTELASTKTVAHTIALGTTTQTFGAWTVTGTVGNVVTLTGTGTSHVIAGAATSGIDYLAMGSIGFAASSPGEFYAGANSTGTAAAPVFRTAPPAARTLYWVGGTGNWGDTARWSTSSGGGGGAAVPTSLDNVIFNSASNATAYTATLNVVARCNQLTIAGPASGNLTLASSATTNSLILHGNTVFPATGFTRTFSSAMVLSGSTTGKTFTSNGVAFQGLGSGAMIVNGVGAGWSMSDPLNLGNNDSLNLINGTFSTNNHGLTVAILRADTGGSKTLNLGSSTVTMSGTTTPIQFGSTETIRNLFTFNAGSSQINISTTGVAVTITGNSLAFNHMSITATVSAAVFTLNGTSTYNNLTFGAPPASGLQNIVINGNTVVTGTLTFTAGTDATRRHFCRTGTIGTGVTITCAAFSGTDVDFRDITITGAAAPISGTRLGNCKGNSGITFPTAKTVYFNESGSNWTDNVWALTIGGVNSLNNFPLAQDTVVFRTSFPTNGSTLTFNAGYHIGTLDMSPNSGEFTFTLSNSLSLYGNLINSLGVTYAGTSQINFSGRTTQTITSSGRSFARPVNIENPNGTVVLLDAFSSSAIGTAFTLAAGTFNANNFNVTFTSGTITISPSSTSTLNTGNGTWTFASSGTVWAVLSSTNLTITGDATITMTSSSAKTFAGFGLNYSGITLNQGGAGALTITGGNTFRDITATQTATSAATINLSTTTQRLTRFTGKGEATRLLTIQGTNAANPCTLVLDRTGPATNSAVNFLNLIGVRAYLLTDTWYAGNNSTNGGTLGWIFSPTPGALPGNGNFYLMFL